MTSQVWRRDLTLIRPRSRADIPCRKHGLIAPGTLLVIPDRITEKTTPNIQIIPDSEMVFSATAMDFDIATYVKNSGGIHQHIIANISALPAGQPVRMRSGAWPMRIP